MANKILVTGSTGTVGSAVVKALKGINENFVAASREVAKVREKFGQDVEAVSFEFADKTTFEQAVEGVDRVFLIGPPLDTNLDSLLTPFVDFLKHKNIKRVVYLSAFGVDKMSDALPFHLVMENKLKEDGFDLTILRPTFFAQNFKNYDFENITERKIVFSPATDGKVGFVDILDVGEVAAKVLTTSGHEGKEYDLTGPELLSYYDAADLLTEILNEKIVYPAPSPEEYRQVLGSAGAPEFVATYMNNVYALIREGHANRLTTDIEKVLGRKPVKLRNVLERDFAGIKIKA